MHDRCEAFYNGAWTVEDAAAGRLTCDRERANFARCARPPLPPRSDPPARFVAGCRPALDRHYNGRWTREALAAGALSPLTPELEHFLVFQEDYAHLKVHRTEWFIFDERLRLCGAIDVVYWDERLQAYVIYDYKRARDLKLAPAGAYDTKYGTSLATAHTYDTNYWHYCVQLMAYKLILERNYGIAIAEMWLIWLHPFQPSYRLLQVHWDAPLMAALVAQRQLDLLAPWAPQAPPGAPEPVDTA